MQDREVLSEGYRHRNKVLGPYDIFLIIGIISTNAIYSVTSGTLDIIGSVAAVTGVLCVVLVAKGSIWNYLFGLVNVSLYAFSCISLTQSFIWSKVCAFVTSKRINAISTDLK